MVYIGAFQMPGSAEGAGDGVCRLRATTPYSGVPWAECCVLCCVVPQFIECDCKKPWHLITQSVQYVWGVRVSGCLWLSVCACMWGCVWMCVHEHVCEKWVPLLCMCVHLWVWTRTAHSVLLVELESWVGEKVGWGYWQSQLKPRQWQTLSSIFHSLGYPCLRKKSEDRDGFSLWNLKQIESKAMVACFLNHQVQADVIPVQSMYGSWKQTGPSACCTEQRPRLLLTGTTFTQVALQHWLG